MSDQIRDRLKPPVRQGAFAGALLLGFLADQLVRTPGRPGLNILLWAMAGTAGLWLVSRQRETPVSRETWWFVGSAGGFAVLLVLRDAEALAVFCLFSGLVLLGLAAGRGALEWARRAHIVDVAAAAVRVGVLIALGPVGWSIGAARDAGEPAPAGGRVWPRYAKMVGRGTAMALPPLFVLTALLANADPVFERLLEQTLFFQVGPFLQHVAFTAVIAWLTSGFLRAFLVNDDDVMDRVRLPRPTLAPSEIAIAVTLLNVLFLVFLAVQVRYLFGGASLVDVTAGLSYAEYARRGFFELVAATAFVVPVLLVADWAAAEDKKHSRRVLRVMSIVTVVLLLGVLASAAYRMRLYQVAYGMTESRLYVSVFMVWLIGVLGALAATVLRGRRRGFAFAAIVDGLACIAVLHILNPHALIARVNISRAASGAKVDASYLRTLGADAVPALMTRLPALPNAERCQVAAMFKEKWAGERQGGWRTWNFADARARKLVAGFSIPADCPVTLPIPLKTP